jgi:DNA-binding transcriptional LysR family regulator
MDRHLAIQCFCRVVETGSFAAAARDLDCSRSVVTKYIHYLEGWTRSRLISRTTRSMQLTQAGEQFYSYCKRVIEDTEETISAIRDDGGKPRGRLVVSAPVSLTLAWLGEHLQAFAEAHQQLELEVRLSDRNSDLVREGIDVALRGTARLEDSSFVALPLAVMERSLAASPAFWRKHGKPRHPREVDPRQCLPYLMGSDSAQWRFFGPDGEHTVDVAGRFRADNSLLLVEAVKRGLGASLLMHKLLEREGAALETAMPEYRAEPRSLYAVYPSRRYLPARTSALVRFLRSRLAENVTSRSSVRASDTSEPDPGKASTASASPAARRSVRSPAR